MPRISELTDGGGASLGDQAAVVRSAASRRARVNFARLANIAAMTALTEMSDNDTVEVLGYTTEGDGGGGTFYWDAASTATANSGTIFAADAGGTGRWIRVYSGHVNVRWFGAVADGATNDASAVQAAIDALTLGGAIFFPSGVYYLNTAITLGGNITFLGENGSVLNAGTSLTTAMAAGTSLSNVAVKSLKFEGPGTAGTSGTERLLELNGCTNVQIDGCAFQTSRVIAVVLDACVRVRVSSSEFLDNYHYGMEIRDVSEDVAIINCVFKGNGSTGTATSTIGRGLNLWEVNNAVVSNCVFRDNNEYGLRVYSQSGDTDGSRNISVSNCAFDRNGSTGASGIDLYLYNEGGNIERIDINGCTFNTLASRTAISLQGADITVQGCTIENVSAQTGNAFALNNLSLAAISSCIIRNFNTGFSFGSSSPATNCTISNCRATGVARFTGTVIGAGHVLSSCYAVHGGSGTTDIGIDLTGASVDGAKVIGCTLDGFYRGASMNDSAVHFVNNTTLNTDDASIRKFGTSITGFVFYGNDLDIATNPAEFGYLNINAQPNARVIGFNSAAPTTLTYVQGDIFFDTTAAAAGTVGRVCVTGGTPGTWKTFGTISA